MQVNLDRKQLELIRDAITWCAMTEPKPADFVKMRELKAKVQALLESSHD